MNQYGNKKDISVLCSTKYVHRVINYNEEEITYLKILAMHNLCCDD